MLTQIAANYEFLIWILQPNVFKITIRAFYPWKKSSLFPRSQSIGASHWPFIMERLFGTLPSRKLKQRNLVCMKFDFLFCKYYFICYIVAIFSWDRICCCCRPNDTEKEVLTSLVQPKPIPVLISINLIVPKVFVVKKYQLTWCSLLKLYRLCT